MGKKIRVAELPTPHLPPVHAKELRAALKPLLKSKNSRAVRAFLSTAEILVANFCEFEAIETHRPKSATKAELKRLRGKIYKFEKSLRRLSAPALIALDSVFEYEFDPQSGSFKPDSKDALALVDHARLATPAVADRIAATYHVATTVLLLMRIGSAIDETLKSVNLGKGGSPFKMAWRDLARRLGHALSIHLGVKPSSTSQGLLEQVLSECLKVGLRVIDSEKNVPGDLHQYARSAVRILKGTKPRHK